MSMHLRNSRDLMVSQELGWWTSKTSLEQKLIVLSSVLFILSFCLVISVIVINNRKPAKGEVTTITPIITEGTVPTDVSPVTSVKSTTVESKTSEDSGSSTAASTTSEGSGSPTAASTTSEDSGSSTAASKATEDSESSTAAKNSDDPDTSAKMDKPLDPGTSPEDKPEDSGTKVDPEEQDKLNKEIPNEQERDTKLNSDKSNSPSNEENVRTEEKRSLHDFNFLGIPMQKRKLLLFGVGL